jgi:hypothetical protein
MITPDMIEFGLVDVSIKAGTATKFVTVTYKFTKSYRKKAADVPKILRQYFRRSKIHGIFLVRKLLFSNSRPSCIRHRASTTNIGKKIETLYMAWNATLRSLPLPIRLIR